MALKSLQIFSLLCYLRKLLPRSPQKWYQFSHVHSVSLNPCKSTGIDKILAKIIRIAAPAEIGQFSPKLFHLNGNQLGPVIPLDKKGPKTLLKNCHPISILPIISKIFEKVQCEQLYDF